MTISPSATGKPFLTNVGQKNLKADVLSPIVEADFRFLSEVLTFEQELGSFFFAEVDNHSYI